MKRRSFLAGLTALLAGPKPALSIGGGAQTTMLYERASFLARAHNRCSIPMLMRHLKLDATAAAEMERVLIQRGVITVPIGGVSLAAHPTNTHCLPLDAPKQSERLAQLRKFAERFLDRDTELEIGDTESRDFPEPTDDAQSRTDMSGEDARGSIDAKLTK